MCIRDRDTGRSAIDFSAAVSVEGANRNTLGYMIVPRGTTTQRNALRDAHNQGSTLLTGSMFYDTSLNKLCVNIIKKSIHKIENQN